MRPLDARGGPGPAGCGSPVPPRYPPTPNGPDPAVTRNCARSQRGLRGQLPASRLPPVGTGAEHRERAGRAPGRGTGAGNRGRAPVPRTSAVHRSLAPWPCTGAVQRSLAPEPRTGALLGAVPGGGAALRGRSVPEQRPQHRASAGPPGLWGAKITGIKKKPRPQTEAVKPGPAVQPGDTGPFPAGPFPEPRGRADAGPPPPPAAPPGVQPPAPPSPFRCSPAFRRRISGPRCRCRPQTPAPRPLGGPAAAAARPARPPGAPPAPHPPPRGFSRRETVPVPGPGGGRRKRLRSPAGTGEGRGRGRRGFGGARGGGPRTSWGPRSPGRARFVGAGPEPLPVGPLPAPAGAVPARGPDHGGFSPKSAGPQGHGSRCPHASFPP